MNSSIKDFKTSIVSVEVININPSMAMKMLEHVHHKNRSVSKATVDRYARAMSDGRFDGLNGETIIIDELGNLLDGQHRLWAVVTSGVTMPFLVVTPRGTSDEIIKTIDGGYARSISDFLNCKNKNIVGPLAAVAFCIKKGNAPIGSAILGLYSTTRGQDRRPPREWTITYAEENIEEFEMLAQDAVAIRKNLGAGSSTYIAIALWIARHYGDGTKYRRFVDEMRDIAPDEPCIQACIGSIRKGFMNGSKLERDELMRRVLWGYDSYAEGGKKVSVRPLPVWKKYADIMSSRERRVSEAVES